MAYMKSATLSKARYLVLERLLETNPSRDAQVRALLTETIEVDMSELTETGDGIVWLNISFHMCDFLPVSVQYSDLHLITGYSQPLDSKSAALNTKEKDIVEYLMQLLKSQPEKLWQGPPVLVAAAFPSGSILFRMYFNDIGKQFNEASSLTNVAALEMEWSTNTVHTKRNKLIPSKLRDLIFLKFNARLKNELAIESRDPLTAYNE